MKEPFDKKGDKKSSDKIQDEMNLQPDWTKATLVFVETKQSIHLRLEQEIIDFSKAHGKGYISRMQAVLKAYANAYRPHLTIAVPFPAESWKS